MDCKLIVVSLLTSLENIMRSNSTLLYFIDLILSFVGLLR